MRKQTSLNLSSRKSPPKAKPEEKRPELRRQTGRERQGRRHSPILDGLAALFALVLALAPFAGSAPARAQETGEEDYEDYEGYDESDFEGGDLYDSVEGLDDENGLYQLDSVTAETFEKMTSMERENAIMKLQIEQEKLKIDLDRQRAEKKKVAMGLEDDERNRQLQIEDQEKKLAEERKRERETAEKQREEAEKKKRDEEMNSMIMEKVKNADLSNPEEVQAINQLMKLAGGDSMGQISVDTTSGAKKETPIEDKFAIKSILGAGGNLVANMENREKGTTIKIRAGTDLDGWTVESIKNSSILLRKEGASKIMYLNQ